MFIATLFTIAKTWKQPTCPLTEEQIRRRGLYIYIYIQWNIIHKKKNEIMPSATTWMDLEIIILNKVSQKDRYRITYM